MTKTYIFWILLAVAGITAYNAFLIQRDNKMFEAYDHAQSQVQLYDLKYK